MGTVLFQVSDYNRQQNNICIEFIFLTFIRIHVFKYTLLGILNTICMTSTFFSFYFLLSYLFEFLLLLFSSLGGN